MTGLTVRVPIVAADGQRIGELILAKLPRGTDEPWLEGAVGHVVEGGVYRFEISLHQQPACVVLEPGDEIFSFDSDNCLTGRFAPRQHVGELRIGVSAPDPDVSGVASIEVAPTKLEYQTEYQRMLDDIASVATEALLQGFAPASLALARDATVPSQLLYQQFAFLSARLMSREMRDAFALILANPHRAWHADTELQPVGRPIPGGVGLARAAARPGPRVATRGRLKIPSAPRTLERRRTEATFDSVPNRFVKYALERWRWIAQRLIDALGVPDANGRGPVRRGRAVARQIQAQIDGVLSAPLFAHVGSLSVFPAANQVLHRQAGYRDVFRTYALAEVGARLSMDLGIEDLFSASQRNVATLYEYWAFLQLLEAVGAVCGEARSVQAFALASDGLSLGFRQGRQSGVSWSAAIGGRQLAIEVFFNRQFISSQRPLAASSWSRAMRPDCSIRVSPRTSLPDGVEGSLDVWLHFDAKYRVDRAREQFDAAAEEPESAAAEAEIVERLDRSKREDLLKMHAYRDAIRGSTGAYVLFPGDFAGAPFREFTEPLPGLGAFALRPNDSGQARGRDALERFIDVALHHVADRASQDERYRYWRGVIRGRPEPGSRGKSFPRLPLPPRDARVICSWGCSRHELDWISRMRTLAFPVDDPGARFAVDLLGLGAEWALLASDEVPITLWERESAWFVQNREELKFAAYPSPTANAYMCAVVRPVHGVDSWVRELDASSLRHLDPPKPTVIVSWADVLEAANSV